MKTSRLSAAALWLPAALLTLAALPQHASQTARTVSGERRSPETRLILALRDCFQQMQTVHLRAHAQVFIKNPDEHEEATGRGTFEYWADGSKWRVNSVTDARLRLMEDMEFAFDGEYFQNFMIDSRVISILRGDPGGMIPSALPNPLFLPAKFAAPTVNALRLAELRTAFEGATGVLSWEADTAQMQERAPISNSRVFSGQAVDDYGRAFRSVVHLSETNGRAMVVSIETESVADGMRELIEFSDYRPVENASFSFPRRIVLKSVMPGSESTLPDQQVEFHIEIFEHNLPIEPDVFTIDWDRAEIVWDNDEKRNLKGAKLTHP